MKLIEHVLKIRNLIQQAFSNRFDRLGLKPDGMTDVSLLPSDKLPERRRIEDILKSHLTADKSYSEAREEAINEFVFTLFNRIAAVKVMETRELFPEVIRRRIDNAGRSFAHNQWLEEYPEMRDEEREGLLQFIASEFDRLGAKLPIFRPDYPYAMMPTADELYQIIEAFNAIDDDPECDKNWGNDDILGWLYENFNAVEKKAFKDSGDKTEYDKVSLQSQVYTPQWVVKFLVDNTLVKIYLEMHPDSALRSKYQVANVPTERTRQPKDVRELCLIDPAQGGGNFLVYALEVFYDLYTDQIDNYGLDISRRDIPKLILENNIYGVDLDERATQMAQIGLYIKAWQLGGRRANLPQHLNVVSTHFTLPTWEEIEMPLLMGGNWTKHEMILLKAVWRDLGNAHKFGTLIRVEETLDGLEPVDDYNLFAEQEKERRQLFDFRRIAVDRLRQQLQNLDASPYSMSKVNDALTFLEILIRKFDVAVANPPYTDSADFGKELKEFIEENYRRPYKANINLYGAFIKRNCELIGDHGKVGMVNPPTFMYIKTFEDIRRFMLSEMHIDLFVEWGYLGMFSPSARVDSAMFILDKGNVNNQDTWFIKLNDLYEMKRYDVLMKAYTDLCNGIENERVYKLSQDKLKEIKSWPFIYWISDDFRKKLSLSSTIDDKFGNRQGLHTANNNRFLRYWWEILAEKGSKWFSYVKGGPFNKWYGNRWLCVDWENDGFNIKNLRDSNGKQRSRPQSEKYYFEPGITYCSSGSKGASFRIKEAKDIFDTAGSCIFQQNYMNQYALLGILNSSLVYYILDCFNPTVGTQVGDIGRLPIVERSDYLNEIIERSSQNVLIKKHLTEYSIIEPLFKQSPIVAGKQPKEALADFYKFETGLLTQVLINEAIINEKVFEIYELTDHDRQMVLDKEGIPVGSLSLSQKALDAFKEWMVSQEDFKPTDEAISYTEALPINDEQPRIDDFDILYQSHNDWEEFCIRHNMSPIEVWYQFCKSGVLPSQRTQELAFELVTDVIRSVLATDDDGIVPLVERTGEDQLTLSIESEMIARGYSPAAISQVFGLLGMPLDRYLLGKFFQQLSDRLNLFMYLPKTPFIWHLSSGPSHALELYISIYRWSRDALYRVKSVYASNRESALRDRLAVLEAKGDATSREEADNIKLQLKELKSFCDKVDDLLASGYDPKLDDGVGKNIAPIQKRGMLAYEVLNAGQLKKYLNADW